MLVKASYEASQEWNRKEGNGDINPKCFSSVAQQLWYLSKIIRIHVRLLALHCVVIAAQGSTAHTSAPLPTCFSASLNSSPSKEGTDGCQVSRANKLQVSARRKLHSPQWGHPSWLVWCESCGSQSCQVTEWANWHGHITSFLMHRGVGEHCSAELLLCTSIKNWSNISPDMWRTETLLGILLLQSVTSEGLWLMTWVYREFAAAADTVFNLAVWDYV